MHMLKFTLIVLVSCFFSMGSAVTLFADEYLKLPILVNLQGFQKTAPDDSDDIDISTVKFLLKKNIIDANRILLQCKSKLSKKRILQLGPLVFKENPKANGSPEPGTSAWRDNIKKGKNELKKKFKGPKGQKLYMVKGGLGSKDGRAMLPITRIQKDRKGKKTTVDVPVAWVKASALRVDRDGGITGNIIVHELLHNAGVKDHTPNTGSVMDDPRQDLDRRVTKTQCEHLGAYFLRHGLIKPNKAQKTAFIPETTTTHYALGVAPSSGSDLAWVSLSLDETQTLMGDIVWQDPSLDNTSFETTFGINLDWDNNPQTGMNADQFGGIDGMVQVSLIGQEDGFLSVVGDLYVYSSFGELLETLPLDDVLFAEIFSAADTGAARPESGALHFEINLQGIFSSSENIMTYILNAQRPSNLMIIGLNTLSPLPELSSPTETVSVGTSFALDGQAFTPQHKIEVSLMDPLTSTKTPLTTTTTDGQGRFLVSVILPTLRKGDYLVEALDENGQFAFYVLTVLGTNTSIAEALDINDSHSIDDAEILQAIGFWIMGTIVPGTDQFIDDDMILALIKIWISGSSIGS